MKYSDLQKINECLDISNFDLVLLDSSCNKYYLKTFYDIRDKSICFQIDNDFD